jgi:hypothetical protein
MKEWEQILIMALTCLIISATLIVIAATSSTSLFYDLFLGPSYGKYPARVVLEAAIGTFALALGVGLLVLAYPVHRLEERSALPRPLIRP